MSVTSVPSPAKRRRRIGRRDLSPGDWLTRVVSVLLAVTFGIFFIIPIVWLLLAPTKTQPELLRDRPLTVGSWATLRDNFSEMSSFQDGIIWTWLTNSIIYAGGALIITLLTAIPAGYALALIDFHFRRALLTMTLVIMLIPNTALVLPVFLELSKVGLVGSAWSVILPFSFFPFGVYLTYIYFSTTISTDLLDAARLDGAGELRVFASVAMPLAKPVIALVAFFNFVANWNNYFLPFVMLPGRKSPVQVGIAELLSNVPLFNPTSGASITISLPVLALATLISVGPVLVLFLFSQRFLVQGMTAGGVKE